MTCEKCANMGYVMALIPCPECGEYSQPPFDPCENCGYASCGCMKP